MAKKNGKKSEHKQKERKANAPAMDPRAKKELVAICLAMIALVSFLAFFKIAGQAGSFIDSALSATFGLNKYLVPFVLLALAGRIAFPERFTMRTPTTLGLFLFLVSLGALMNAVRWRTADSMLYLDHLSVAGGYVGLILGYPLMSLTGLWASLVILTGILAVSLVLTFNVSLHELSVRLMGLRHMSLPWPFGHRRVVGGIAPIPDEEPEFVKKETTAVSASAPKEEGTASDEDEAVAAMAPILVKRKRYKPMPIPVDLLEARNAKPTAGDVAGKMHVIQKTLENFGIPVEMGEVSVGPTVTQFSLKPADGIKLNRITSLSNDLALTLAAHPIRIEAPIPGKSLVGIEVPNQAVAVVSLREVLESKEFRARSSNLTVCLGKDVAGKPWIANLGKMPHMLVAGATGSGKTVCLNAIILSLIYQNSPDDLKLMLIDPKRVELPVYNGIPHLLTPAITEVPKIINALKWALGEMDRRFSVLEVAKKRDIDSYNEVAEEKMPYLVIVVDELADLMVASAAEVEGAIIRLAQMARAVGIHLVVATQRPSVDVITGLIKANITARIAFSVASQTDSRTILDQPGAEKLVGRGDSLFISSDLSQPKRIQCCYVGDNEIRKVVDYLMEQLDEPVHYEEGVTEKNKAGGNDFGYNGDGEDELLEEARDTVVRAGKASASYLQRRLKIGYARAARLLDLLEERGIIGPGDGAKPRQILVAPVGDVDGNHFNDLDDENS
ncbi:MAG TPA: DNA translocase FtsK 4TM domain-containing protein [Candidatus Eisenbacteria bacterium]|nr:DNA translocase FtsK 4TM domain-containing protein [Candidatus Eisenbacteria bacterium]